MLYFLFLKDLSLHLIIYFIYYFNKFNYNIEFIIKKTLKCKLTYEQINECNRYSLVWKLLSIIFIAHYCLHPTLLEQGLKVA